MASSLCACPALFFKIIILCVCSELLQRPFPALAECLKPISPRDVLDSFLSPRAGAHTHTPANTHGRISPSHGPLPGPLPFLLPLSSLRTQSAESSHHRRFRKAICREIWANSASRWTLSVSSACNPSVHRGHKLALYPPGAPLKQREIQGSNPPLPRPLSPTLHFN